MPDPLVLVDRDGDIATLTFNDPERRNAMSRAMGECFAREVAELCREAGLRAVVLTGAGRAFSAGGDLGMIEEQAREGAAEPGIARRAIRDTMRSFYKLFLSVRGLPCPTIAAINKIVPRFASQSIVARPAEQSIVARGTGHDVVASETMEYVVIARADEQIGAQGVNVGKFNRRQA